MNDEKLVQIFSGIDDEIIGQANEDLNFWLESQKGVAVRAEKKPCGSLRKTVIASVGGIAAAFGVFVLLLNVIKGGSLIYPDDPESTYSGSGLSSIIDSPTAPEIENPEQIFTKDYDGLVLTVTTDKSTYNTGEQVNLTAALENNTGKDIYLYYSDCGAYGYDGSKAGESAELMPRFEHLIEYPVRSAVWYDTAIEVIPFGQGEKCVQYFTFQTYTDYIYFASPTGQYKDEVIPDLNKAAEPGAHYGKLAVATCLDTGEYYQSYYLDFSVTIAQQNSENPSRTFTKDFDGLILTVTTDKSVYSAGDTVNLTAVLENNTGRDIYLYYGYIPNTAVDMRVKVEGLITDPIVLSESTATAEYVPLIENGDMLGQSLRYQTYTGIIQAVSEDGGLIGLPDPEKVAEAGVYNGSCTIFVCGEPNYPHGDMENYSLDFSIVIE